MDVMKMQHVIRNLHPVSRNAAWLRSGIPWGMKARYYASMGVAYVRLATTGRKRIRYLGRRLEFDNPATPLNLQVYPYEVSHHILGNIDRIPESVLDIGGNIGQFALTVDYFCEGRAHIDVFEPNPSVFELLRRNLAPLAQVTAYNHALSPEPVGEMFYEPGRSATGSLIRENASDDRERIEAVTITSVAAVPPVTGRTHYDLVKIDVEGYELEVLRCLEGVTARHVFVEFSGLGRRKRYPHSEFLAELRRIFGEYDIVYERAATRKSDAFEMLVEIVGQE